MKILVTYISKTGFTHTYSQWIAERLNCDLLPFNRKAKQVLANYDLIIFGGGILGGFVNGLMDFKKCPEYLSKKVIVFATGATDHNAETIVEGFKTNNLQPSDIDRVPFFFFESGINYESMGFFSKMVLKMMHSMLSKKKDLSSEDKGMLETIATSCDYTKTEYIEPLIQYVKSIDK